MQQITVNHSHGLLYSIMHQGPAETYEHPGPEVWVYDLETKTRIKRIVTERIAVSIHVSPDDSPLLFSLPDNEATLDIYDGLTNNRRNIFSLEEKQASADTGSLDTK
jgi:methylamine dehydrogenase heavy chain